MSKFLILDIDDLIRIQLRLKSKIEAISNNAIDISTVFIIF